MLRSKVNEILITNLQCQVYRMRKELDELREVVINDRKQMDKHSNAKKASQKNKVQ